MLTQGVAEFRGRKIWPRTYKQGGNALTPMMDGVSRQVTRRINREIAKDARAPQASRAAIRRRRAAP